MGHRVQRQSKRLDIFSTPPNPVQSVFINESPLPQKEFLADILETYKDEVPIQLKNTPAEMHQEAREQVFENILANTFNHPKSPYAHLPISVRRRMYDAIHEILRHSHYLER